MEGTKALASTDPPNLINENKVWVADLEPQTKAFSNQQLPRVAAQMWSAKIYPTLDETTPDDQRNADHPPAHYNTT